MPDFTVGVDVTATSDDAAITQTKEKLHEAAEAAERARTTFEDLGAATKAMDEYQKQLEKSLQELNGTQKKNTESVEENLAALNAIVDKYDKAGKKIKDYEDDLAKLSEMKRKGRIDADQYAESLKKMKEGYEGTGKEASGFKGQLQEVGAAIATKLAKVFALLEGLKLLWETMKEGFLLYIEEERRLRSIISLMESFGGASREQVSAVREWAEGMKEVGVSAGDALKHLQHMIPAAGDAENAMRAVALAMDIAATTGRDLSTVQRGVEQLMMGNTYALTSVRGGLFGLADGSKGAEAALQDLNEMYGGTNRLLDDHLRTVERATALWENAKETIGQGAAALADLVVWLGDATAGFQNVTLAWSRIETLGAIKEEVAKTTGAFKSYSAMVKESRSEVAHLNSENAHLGSLLHRGLISEKEHAEGVKANNDALDEANKRLETRITLMEQARKALYDMKGIELPEGPKVSDKGREEEDKKKDQAFDKEQKRQEAAAHKAEAAAAKQEALNERAEQLRLASIERLDRMDAQETASQIAGIEKEFRATDTSVDRKKELYQQLLVYRQGLLEKEVKANTDAKNKEEKKLLDMEKKDPKNAAKYEEARLNVVKEYTAKEKKLRQDVANANKGDEQAMVKQEKAAQIQILAIAEQGAKDKVAILKEELKGTESEEAKGYSARVAHFKKMLAQMVALKKAEEAQILATEKKEHKAETAEEAKELKAHKKALDAKKKLDQKYYNDVKKLQKDLNKEIIRSEMQLVGQMSGVISEYGGKTGQEIAKVIGAIEQLYDIWETIQSIFAAKKAATEAATTAASFATEKGKDVATATMDAELAGANQLSQGDPYTAIPRAAAAVATGMGYVAAISGVEMVPMMAKGGLVNAPTLALIGEAGPEVVAPKQDFTSFAAELLGRPLGAGPGNSYDQRRYDYSRGPSVNVNNPTFLSKAHMDAFFKELEWKLRPAKRANNRALPGQGGMTIGTARPR